MVYSAILNLLFAMMFHNKLILTAFEGWNVNFPNTIKYDTFIFNPDLPKDHYIQIGFKEVSIGQSPEQIVFYDDLKCMGCQYELLHCVTGIIHGAMGDTYNRIGILLIDTEKYFHYGIAASWLLVYRALG